MAQNRNGKGEFVGKIPSLSLNCPFFQNKVVLNRCEGLKCAIYVVVVDPDDNRVVIQGCGMKLGAEYSVKLFNLLSNR